MMTRPTVVFSAALACALVFGVGGCKKKKTGASGSGTAQKKPEMFGGIEKDLLDNYKPLPESFDSKTNAPSADKIALGRMLYYETRLSRGHDVSCNTCHMLDKFGVDSKVVSDGHGGQKGTRNSPTVYNAAGHFVQFWDGRAKDVEEQAKGPILNPVEMAMKKEADVVAVLASIPGYVEAFKKAFPKAKEPITYDNLAAAIGAFERKLVTPAPWDKFLAGDASALTQAQKDGFKQFVSAGCPTCHSGPLVGGHIYQKLGLVKPWPSDKDKGRFEATKKDDDKMMFKVPSLRNIVKTAPYFHDGSVKELEKAVTMMAWHQLGRKVTPAQAKSIVTFLGALTGEVPADTIKKPELPKSGPKTPKADKTVDKPKAGDKTADDKKAADKKADTKK